MPQLRWGPGPVFIHESIAATRRWQLYASRAFFVLGLLGGLSIAWLLIASGWGMGGNRNSAGTISIKQLALMGQYIYYAIATVQIALVLLIAPAATAASICLDRARGTLTHMCVTDLTNSEIVLGKLAARLLPVLSLVLATVPVLALTGLLGGVIIEAIVSLTLITLTLAVFGCSLAMAISVRATKTHEVLMAVYGIEALWVMGPLIWSLLEEIDVVPDVPDWLIAINPFELAWGPYAWPDYLTPWMIAAVLGGMLTISIALVIYSIFALRADLTQRRRAPFARLRSWLGTLNDKIARWRPSPSLDEDPVLWREWHRGRPSRMARFVWGMFIILALAGTGWGLITLAGDQVKGAQLLQCVNGFQATFGLLLLSLTAPTVLAEERVRGSLDVLLATPLSTDRIVLSKWWGTYRIIPALALLPAIGSVFIAATEPTFPELHMARVAGYNPIPVDIVDRIAHVCFPMALLLVQGAVVTSFGLALATWIHRIGRAVAINVATFVFFVFGWIVFLEMGFASWAMRIVGFLPTKSADDEQFCNLVFGTVCPLGSQLFVLESVSGLPEESRRAFYVAEIVVFLALLLAALFWLGLTLATFDRCMGRVPEHARRAPRPPRRLTVPSRPHGRSGTMKQRGMAGLET